jgi:hypothetical protein
VRLSWSRGGPPVVVHGSGKFRKHLGAQNLLRVGVGHETRLWVRHGEQFSQAADQMRTNKITILRWSRSFALSIVR